MRQTMMTYALNAMASVMPDAMWRNSLVLKMMAAMAGLTLSAGKLALQGRVPNGQWYVLNPTRIWIICESHAVWNGKKLDHIGPIAKQDKLGDFWVPSAGFIRNGPGFFEVFNPLVQQVKVHDKG